MRFLSALLGVVLGAGILFAGGPSTALADSPEVPVVASGPVDETLPVAAQPGTLEEAQAYEQREAESPEVQEFEGGDVVIGVSAGVLVLGLLILLVILLSQD